MLVKKNIIFILLLFVSIWTFGQPPEKYLIVFKDKKGSTFDPYSYFDSKAIARRHEHQLPLNDYTDYPVSQEYLMAISPFLSDLKVVSRWLNGVVAMVSPEKIHKIISFHFVSSVESLEPTYKQTTEYQEIAKFKLSIDTQMMQAQTDRMGAKIFAENKITGQGVRIAVFDIGFESYKTNEAFAHIRKNNKFIKTWDFVKNRENVDGYNTHGCNVLSCIGGMVNGIQIGLATDAEYLLARTETWTEFYSEEENWLAAAEWADKNGAQIINSSLGYTFQRYFPEDMNGQKSLVCKAANLAARKGILVVNSAGNEGDNGWKIIGTPADADSVLSIGGIKPSTGYHTGFSSFGPTKDKRMKPNVSAYGHVIAAGPKGLNATQGTSFSGPLVAGFAACAKQVKPSLNNMELFREIEKSGDLYPYFDYAHGYGVPQAGYFFDNNKLVENGESLLELKDENGKVYINVLDKVQSLTEEYDSLPFFDSDVRDTSTHDDQIAENQIPGSKTQKYYTKCPEYVFFHIENNRGYLDKYFIVNPGNRDEKKLADDVNPLIINKIDYARPFTIRVYYKGEVKSYKVE
jgi:hypothetical protein